MGATAEAVVQPGGHEALSVAPAIVRVTKPTWNMKQRLVRQKKCCHQDQSGVGFVDSA